jgi:sulfur dioxygenase
MYFRQLFVRESSALTYVLADPRHRDAVVIDPQPRQDELLLALLAERDLQLNLVLRTHLHADELSQCDGLCRHTGAQLVIGAGAIHGPAGARKVGHGETLVFGDEVLRVLATPGHTPESTSFLWRDRLFCGDALGIRVCAAADDPACDPGRIYDSVTRRLFLLPDETLVFPGHEVDGRTVSTIAEERQRNPYFASQSRDAFTRMLVAQKQSRPVMAQV